jgi:hypothetical protein
MANPGHPKIVKIMTPLAATHVRIPLKSFLSFLNVSFCCCFRLLDQS